MAVNKQKEPFAFKLAEDVTASVRNCLLARGTSVFHLSISSNAKVCSASEDRPSHKFISSGWVEHSAKRPHCNLYFKTARFSQEERKENPKLPKNVKFNHFPKTDQITKKVTQSGKLLGRTATDCCPCSLAIPLGLPRSASAANALVVRFLLRILA